MDDLIMSVAGITGFALGVAQNATWDVVKHVVGKMLASGRLNLEGLLVTALCKAIDEHNRDYDEVSRKALLDLRAHIQNDPTIVTDALRVFTYDAFGQMVADLSKGAFQEQLAEQIIVRYLRMEPEWAHDLTVQMVKDALTYYRWMVVSEVTRDPALRLVLLQTSGVQAIERSMATIQNDVSALRAGTATHQQVEEIHAQLRSLIEYMQNMPEPDRESLLKKQAENRHLLFAQQVERIIRAKGFEVERVVAEGVDIVGTKHGAFGLRIAMALESQEHLVGKERVADLYRQLSKLGANIGQFIARQGFTFDAWKYAQDQERAIALRLLTFHEFCMESVDFHPYLDHLVESWEQNEIGQRGLYLHLSGKDEQGQVHCPLDAYLLQYLDRDRRNRIALLGDFGTGKTTFCSHFAHRLARQYKEQPTENRIPVLIELREYDSVRDIYQLVVRTLQRGGVPDINAELLIQLMRHGRFIFICDGFDEMSYGATRIAVQRNLRTLERMVELGSNALVVACRTHFFRNSVEEPDRLRYEHIHLVAWKDEEIEEYLRRAIGGEWRKVMEKITSTYNLRELASTPLFLEMIVSSIDQLHGVINAGRLYDIYTNRWIALQDYRSMMDQHQKSNFMEEIAWSMFTTGRHKIHWSELRELVQTVFGLVTLEDVGYFDSDVRTCSFLSRNREGNYQFKHKSFMEFFIAKKLFNEILQGISANFEVTQTSYETDQFIKDLLMAEHVAINRLVHWMSSHNSPMVRANSAGVLAKLGNDELNRTVVETLETDSEVREVWLPPLLRRVLKEDTLISIGYEILSESSTVQQCLEHTEEEIQEVTERFIEQLFNKQDLASRWFGARALSNVVLRSDRIIGALLEAVASDPDPGIRSTCARALGRVGDKSITPTLDKVFNMEVDDAVRKDLEQVLAKLIEETARQSSET